MAPWESGKIITGFTAENLDEVLNGIDKLQIEVLGPIEVYISARFNHKIDFDRASGVTYVREIASSLVSAGAIHSTQQIQELGFEKILGGIGEINILICRGK